MDWNLGFVAIIMLTVGLVGQAFEMRKMRLADEQRTGSANPANIFTDKRNFKWYAVIGLGILLWYIAERI